MDIVSTNEDELKRKFAAALLRNPGKPFEAGVEVFGTDTGSALRAASVWIHDPIVVAERDRLTEEEGEMAFLPSKADLARKIYDMASNEAVRMDFKDRLAAFRFYAELRSFIEKPREASGDVTNNVTTNNVMVVRDHGTDTEWSDKLRNQQRKLLENASKPH